MIAPSPSTFAPTQQLTASSRLVAASFNWPPSVAQGTGVWRLGQALMLGAALAITAANTAPIGVGDTPVVLAGVAQGNDNGGN